MAVVPPPDNQQPNPHKIQIIVFMDGFVLGLLASAREYQTLRWKG
jgi:hypothetical protein